MKNKLPTSRRKFDFGRIKKLINPSEGRRVDEMASIGIESIFQNELVRPIFNKDRKPRISLSTLYFLILPIFKFTYSLKLKKKS